MKKNYSLIYAPCLGLLFFLIVFFLQAGFISGNILDDESVQKNEIDAIQFSKVWELDSIAKSIDLFEQTADKWEKLGEPNRAAFCLNETAKLTQIISDYDAAFRSLNKAIKLETDNNLIEEKAISLSLFSLISLQKGDKKNFQKYSQNALSTSQNALTPLAKGYALFCAGMYEYYHGTMKNATSFFEQASIYAQKTQDKFLITQTLFYVGFSYLREGNPNKAVDKMNLALQQSEQFEYQKGKALSYFGIAQLSYFLNEKQKALDFLNKSKSLFPADFEWMERARIVNSIGVIYQEFGELDLAETNFQQAIEYYQRADYPLGRLTTLTSLADIYLAKSNLSQAKQTYNLATKLSVELDDKFRLASIKEGMGNIEFLEDNSDNAIKNYLTALQIYNKIGVKLPNIENLLGNAYEKKRDYRTARKYYNSALNTNLQTKDTLQLSENLFSLAKLDAQAPSLEQAINQINQSLDLTESLYSDVANANLKRSYLSNVYDRYELYINLLMRSDRERPGEDFSSRALQASERARGRALLENLRLSGANFTRDAPVEMVRSKKELAGQLNAKRSKLTDLLSSNAAKDEIKAIEDEARDIENKLEDIKATLKQTSPVYSAIKNPGPFELEMFQREVLDDGAIFLEYSLGKDESYLWVVGKTEVTAYVLPARERIEARVEKLRGLLGGREILANEALEDYQMRIADADAEYAGEARALSSDLLGQAVDKIKGKRLIVVADGRLLYFPIGALPMPGSESDEPILLTNEVVYEPSASALRIFKTETKIEDRPRKDLLVFADPVFSRADERLTGLDAANMGFVSTILGTFRSGASLDTMPRLPASEQEAKSISDVVGANQTTVRSGFAANRESVLNSDITDYKILHFATHGLIDEKRPELSGILLSLFDKDGKPQDGGFIRLQDVYGLNLHADLVVLSACDTGIGKEVKGEGVMSLNNAFLQAGAKSVVSSLWKVDDNATKDLMTEFYRGIASDALTASAALRQAQIKMYNDPRYRSPFYWAAFTAAGDADVKVAFSAGGGRDYFLAVIIGLVGILLLLAVRRSFLPRPKKLSPFDGNSH